MRKIALLTMLLLLLGSTYLSAQNTWTGATSTDWNTASNWSSATVPTADDDVVIPNVTNGPVIGASTAALAHSVEVQSSAALTIQNTGSLTINGSKSVGGFTTAFCNQGTVNNSGQLTIGNLASVGQYGLENKATFNNNTGGEIHIDGSSETGLYNFAGTFTNAASIVIGSNSSVGSYGLSASGTFNNNTGGDIHIDNTTSYGLYNSGTFTNAANILIGATASVGNDGLSNNGTFNNNTGGEIHINNATEIGLLNSSHTFTNAATILIGNTASVGTYALFNGATFNNTGCGALIKVSSDAIITDVNAGSLTNSGNIIENASGNSNITNNSGLVQNLNGGTFTITNNTGLLTTAAGTLWTGCTNADWNTASNWSTTAVPMADDDVLIPDVTNAPVIGTSVAALAHSVFVQNSAALTIQNGGSLTVNGARIFDPEFNTTTAFSNRGTVNNSGQLIIGSLASVGNAGLENRATFNNNTGGEIHIDNATDESLENSFGTFSNAGRIVIGANASPGVYGLTNADGFNNNAGGSIEIDRSTNRGILNSVGTFNNNGRIVIGANASVGYFGLTNQAAFNNNAGGELRIDNSTNAGLENSAGIFNNAARLVIGATAAVGATALQNSTTFNNGACASLALFAALYNNSLFTNQGLFTVNTSGAHSNTGFTNDGAISYPQGNPIPNVTNNDVIILPAGTCTTPILQIGGSNSFTIGTTWYQNANLTTPAGTYNASTNTFTASGLVTGTVYPLYFTVTNGSCTQTTSITATAQTCATCGNATNLTTTGITSTSATFNWTAAINPQAWQVQYKTTNTGSQWIDVKNVTPSARSATITGLKTNQAYMWHIRAKCGNVWTAYSNSVSFKTIRSTLAASSDAVTLSQAPELETDGLHVQVLSNPTASYFTLIIQSSSPQAVNLRLSDAVGRMVEGRTGIASHTAMYIGQNYRPGVYYAQVMQGSKMVTIKLVKQ